MRGPAIGTAQSGAGHHQRQDAETTLRTEQGAGRCAQLHFEEQQMKHPDGLSIYSRPEYPGTRFLRFQWKEGTNELVLETRIMDWNAFVVAKQLRDFSNDLTERAQELAIKAMNRK